MSDAPETTDAGSYAELEAEVAAQFDGSWERFFKAVKNPVEIMHFVLKHECSLNAEKFEAWAKEKGLPEDWANRFFSALSKDGDIKS